MVTDHATFSAQSLTRKPLSMPLWLWTCARSLAQSDIIVALLISLVGCAVRLHFAVTHPHFNNLFTVQGVPYSDASIWTGAAISLAEGAGLGAVYRPLLSVILALIYTWAGSSFGAITVLNVLIGGITGGLIFLVGCVAFNRFIATAAAGWFVLNPSQVVQTPQATTEPLGLMLFVLSVYALCLASEQSRNKPAFLGGICLGLSNLARPLTLFCAPFYALHLFFVELRGGRKWPRAFALPAVFCLGIVLAISPWLVRQKFTHGVWAFSSNMSEAFYAATSPKYRVWTPAVRADPDRDGVPSTVGARYHYFMDKSLENIRTNPRFYAEQVGRSYWEFLSCFSVDMRRDTKLFRYSGWTRLVEAQTVFAWAVIILLMATAIGTWMRSSSLAAGIFLVVSMIMFLAWWLMPLHLGGVIQVSKVPYYFLWRPDWSIGILVFGIASSLLAGHWRSVTVLVWSLAITGLGDALFNNAIFYRAVLLSDWLFAYFYFAAFLFVPAFLTRIIVRALDQAAVVFPFEPGSNLRAESSFISRFENRIKMGLKLAAFVLLVLTVVSSVRLIIANSADHTHRADVPAKNQLSREQMLDVVSRLRTLSPQLRAAFADPDLQPIKFVDPPQERVTGPNNASLDVPIGGRPQVVITAQRLSPFAYFFPAGTEFSLRDPLLIKRTFDCSIFTSSAGGGTIIFPREIPSQLYGRAVVLVGWIEGEHPKGPDYGTVMQCVAIIPIAGKNQLDYDHAVMAEPKNLGIPGPPG
jgi:Dolichyl-phosphate-mannose-protein mannosyltransferase